MRHTHTIKLSKPLRGVRVVRSGPPALPEAEVEAREEAAYQKGYAAAEAAAQQQIVEQRQEVMHLQQNVLGGIEEKFAALSEQINERLPDLVMAITRRVLANFEPDRETVCRVLDEVLADVAADDEDLTVLLCEADLERLQSDEEDRTYDHLTLRADTHLKPGDVVLRSRFGIVDARVSTKLGKIENDLRESHQ